MSDVYWVVRVSAWLAIVSWFQHELWPWGLMILPLAVTIHVLQRRLEDRHRSEPSA